MDFNLTALIMALLILLCTAGLLYLILAAGTITLEIGNPGISTKELDDFSIAKTCILVSLFSITTVMALALHQDKPLDPGYALIVLGAFCAIAVISVFTYCVAYIQFKK